MANITNKSGLPEALVNAVKNDPYSKAGADFSTTELSVPPRIVALKKLHEDELEEDVADRIYALMGKIGHQILENAGTEGLIEKRLFWEIDGTTISGQVDVVEGSILEDWKFCSIWVFREGVKEEWIAQASVNRWLCERNGIPITEARYIALYRDWSKPASLRDAEYPKQQVQSWPVKMWSMEDTEKWIRERIQLHRNALKTLPECSKDERWQRPGKVAVMAKGRKKAVKLLDTRKWAEQYIVENEVKNAYLEDRPSEPVRCVSYCAVSSFCSQHQQYMLTQQENNLDSQ